MSRISKGKSVVAIGTFDGIHRGHQVILALLNEIAMKQGLQRVAYAFVFPPRLAVRAEKRGLLLPEEAKIKVLRRYVDRVERVPFEEVSCIAAHEFVNDVLIGRFGVRAIVVGEGFRFGHNREGDSALLQELCHPLGVDVIVVPPVVIDGIPVSSTRIRWLISKGKVEQAARLLGRPPIILGQVVHGDRLGGILGYPTANLAIDDGILPPGDGIYLVNVFWTGGKSSGLLYAGRRPSVDGREHRLEVHLLMPASDSGDDRVAIGCLYGTTLEVQILQRIRDDQYFPTLSELRHQMGLDVKRACELLTSSKWPEESIIT